MHCYFYFVVSEEMGIFSTASNEREKLLKCTGPRHI